MTILGKREHVATLSISGTKSWVKIITILLGIDIS